MHGHFRKIGAHYCFVLNIGLIRMNILILDTRNVEQTKMYVCTLEEFILDDLDILLHKVEGKLNKHWKNAGLYTLATRD